MILKVLVHFISVLIEIKYDLRPIKSFIIIITIINSF